MIYHRLISPCDIFAGIAEGILLVVMLLLSSAVLADATSEPSIEVFVDSASVVAGEATSIYVIDRIDVLKKTLSSGLPRNPEKAKQVALARFQTMDATLSQQLENAATGLTKAQQYGIDRVPAIVFDGKTLVYGVTDLSVALHLYGQSQRDILQ